MDVANAKIIAVAARRVFNIVTYLFLILNN
jgi:hypothetical protein